MIPQIFILRYQRNSPNRRSDVDEAQEVTTAPSPDPVVAPPTSEQVSVYLY